MCVRRARMLRLHVNVNVFLCVCVCVGGRLDSATCIGMRCCWCHGQHKAQILANASDFYPHNRSGVGSRGPIFSSFDPTQMAVASFLRAHWRMYRVRYACTRAYLHMSVYCVYCVYCVCCCAVCKWIVGGEPTHTIAHPSSKHHLCEYFLISSLWSIGL